MISICDADSGPHRTDYLMLLFVRTDVVWGTRVHEAQGVVRWTFGAAQPSLDYM